MKVYIELNIKPNGVFLNFWDTTFGQDVICEVRNGRLFFLDSDENGEMLPEKEISLQDFINKVKVVQFEGS